MKLAPVILPRLVAPAVRRRADENRSEIRRLDQLAVSLADCLQELADPPTTGSGGWPQVHAAFVAIGSAIESLGDVESALAADEGRWLSQLAMDDPDAGDADAIEFCQDRLGKIRARLRGRRLR